VKQYWYGFIAVVTIGFIVLGWAGYRIYQEKPPIPDRVVTANGKVVFGSGEIEAGQNVWQSMGGMEMGSVWGHGSYVAPDWSADWLHRECEFVLNAWATRQTGKSFAASSPEEQAVLKTRLVTMMRTNTYKPTDETIVIDSLRALAVDANLAYYARLFSEGDTKYSIPKGAQSDPAKLRQLGAFFFWTSWAASTNRPGQEITYTSNWPHEEFVDNHPTPDTVVWTGVSIILLLAGIAGMILYHASRPEEGTVASVPATDPLFNAELTPSQKSTLKFFLVVSGLILVQILVGIITAHYGVEGNAFYGIPLSQWLPYVVTRTWHIQLGIFWIATAWLAAGLYIAPAISGIEMKGQRFGANLLFGALLLIVLGSLAGEWMSVEHKLTGEATFLFGHQGYEYVDLGRIWQIGLLAGLLFWVYLIARNVMVAIRRGDEHKSLLILFLISAVAIGGFYMAGLMWGQHTNLAIAEYWRWWVVHLWVEGFFEVFATVVIILLFAKLKLIRPSTAATAVLLSSTVYLAGGIIGTLHHLYFSGTPAPILALGAVFSALEVVPLVLAGYEAWENLKLSRVASWAARYKWPVYFFLSVAFWNAVGAGLFGFMINPPIALYYMQGLNTTPVHGHAALFGVYGMLGIGLMLFCLRIMWVKNDWKEGLVKVGFWGMNIGLLLMVAGSLLPVGLIQTWASVKTGYWYARSAEFLTTPVVQNIKWGRIFGDTIFAVGAVAVVVFVFGLALGYSFKRNANRS
jgi:nitric oxide reductase subunit B